MSTMENNILNISYNAYRKMIVGSQIVEDKYKEEVLGLLVIEEGKNGRGLTVSDVIFPEQTIGSASCEMKIGETISQKGIPKELIPKIKGWFHSHKTMGCFYSHTDDTTLENWAYCLNYAIGIVVSLNPDKLKCFIQWGKPILTDKVELKHRVDFPEDDKNFIENLKNELDKKIIKKRVKVKTYVKPTQNQFPSGVPHYVNTKKNNGDEEDTEEPVIKEVDELVRTSFICQPHKSMSLDQLPKTTNYGCSYLDFTYPEDVICLATGLPPKCEHCSERHVGLYEGQKQKKKKEKANQLFKPCINFRCDNLRVLTGNNVIRYSSRTREHILKGEFKDDWGFICNLGLPLQCDKCKQLVEIASKVKPLEQTKGEYPKKYGLIVGSRKVFLNCGCFNVGHTINAELTISPSQFKQELKAKKRVRVQATECSIITCDFKGQRGCIVGQWFWIFPNMYVKRSRKVGYRSILCTEEDLKRLKKNE